MANKMMNTIGRVAAGAAALTMVVAATGASAYPRDYYRHHGHNGTGTAIAAGVVGLAIGAAIADSGHHDRYYDRGYAPPPPPPPRYGYGYGYGPRGYYGERECWTTRDYDRWSGRYYERTVCR